MYFSLGRYQLFILCITVLQYRPYNCNLILNYFILNTCMCSNKSATSPYLVVNNGGFYLVFSIILITNISDFTMKQARFINSNDSHMQILKTFIVSNIFYMYLRLIGIFKCPWGKPRNSYFIFNKFLINVSGTRVRVGSSNSGARGQFSAPVPPLIKNAYINCCLVMKLRSDCVFGSSIRLLQIYVTIDAFAKK